MTLILIFMIPWEGGFEFSGLGKLAKAMGFGVGVLWLASILFTKRVRRPGLFHLLLSLFVCWNALSILWTSDPNRTMTQIATWVQLLILAFIIWDLCNTRESLLTGLQVYILGSFFAIGSAIANYVAGDPFYTNYERFSPGNMHPDAFGFILALGIPVAWYLSNTKRDTKWNSLLRIINYTYIPMSFLGIALSGTRAALIASLPGMAFGLLSLNRIRLWKRGVIFLILIFVIILMFPHVQALESFQRFGTISSELSEGDLSSRTIIWREGLETFVVNPLLGVGSNMFRTVNSLGKVAHNTFISVLVEVGLVGFTLFGLILLVAFTKALGHPKWDARFWLTILLVWAIGALTLTWENKKATWLFLSLAISSHAIFRQQIERTAAVLSNRFTGTLNPMSRRPSPASFPFQSDPVIPRDLLESTE